VLVFLPGQREIARVQALLDNTLSTQATHANNLRPPPAPDLPPPPAGEGRGGGTRGACHHRLPLITIAPYPGRSACPSNSRVRK
jgi:HrpA-like RNA helicase